MAAALALWADVHVVTPQGHAPSQVTDAAFEVHLLGSEPDTSVAVKRALVIEALVSSGSDGRQDPRRTSARASSWLRASADLWRDASRVLATIEPDVVVVCGHRHVGMMGILPPSVPVVVVPLCSDPAALGHPLFDPVCERAGAIMMASAAERRAVLGGTVPDAPVHDVGLVVPVNPSVLEEPSTELAGQDYVLVMGASEDGRTGAEGRLLALRFPRNPVVMVGERRLVIWRKGEASDFEPVSRHIDLWRLMAWARCAVDLRPGRLLGLRCIETLLFSTPVVVPEAGRARDVVEDSGGGLWYSDGAELTGCVELLLGDEPRKRLGEQGGRHMAGGYGRRDDFIERVIAVVEGCTAA